MSDYLENMKIETDSVANGKKIIVAGKYRFTVITPCLFRVEKQIEHKFCDFPTQSVINRNFSECEFSVEKIGCKIYITTKECEFCYNMSEDKAEYIILSDKRKVTDFDKGNLKGTCRTLDNANGERHLGNGIVSLSGVATLDDSKSLILCPDGKVLPREYPEKDIYFFAYGYEYRKAVSDLFSLTGKAPLIPRFALGNWWSRYKAYTQKEYTDLMQHFIDEKIPITVATIDMDWHWVDVVKRFGKDALDKFEKKGLLKFVYNTVFPGWTGYTWNTELFPDHKSFLSWLRSNGFRVTMNLHPASGCKFYEDAYSDFCDFLGIDKNSHEQIDFDITDEKFIEGYFRFLHHPHEQEGVDFWWIDWQQGKNTAVKGLDPLWALNHYHSLDISRNGEKRPLILSRFAGAGSQRYPLGFSGDTVQTWESLDFQPYFTATASNIAYSWWSHDIGGHCRGYRDKELYLRWLQFGVFSPINRLHSTSNEFMGKEPWMYDKFTEECAADWLRLRHKLIPYIYSMNRKTANEGRCLIEPMYYSYPKDPRAYNVPNEYFFGTELIVCPITEKTDGKTGLGGTKAFLPKGRFTDIFTGRIYSGNCETRFFRDMSSIPVLAKEGAIIPLSTNGETNDISNPRAFEILISKGNNTFTLYEDDGASMEYKNGAFCETKYCVSEMGGDLEFEICPAEGDLTLIPEKRSYTLKFIDVSCCDEILVTVNGKKHKFNSLSDKDNFGIVLENIAVNAKIRILLTNVRIKKNPDKKTLITGVLSRYAGSNDAKTLKFHSALKNGKTFLLPKELRQPIEEFDCLA